MRNQNGKVAAGEALCFMDELIHLIWRKLGRQVHLMHPDLEQPLARPRVRQRNGYALLALFEKSAVDGPGQVGGAYNKYSKPSHEFLRPSTWTSSSVFMRRSRSVKEYERAAVMRSILNNGRLGV